MKVTKWKTSSRHISSDDTWQRYSRIDCNQGGTSLSMRVLSLDVYEACVSPVEVGRHKDTGEVVHNRGTMDNAASGVDGPEGGMLGNVVVKAMGAHGDGTQAVTATQEGEVGVLGTGEGDVGRSDSMGKAELEGNVRTCRQDMHTTVSIVHGVVETLISWSKP